jgi:protocatechuate 3,4-dioxygenase beta subunit
MLHAVAVLAVSTIASVPPAAGRNQSTDIQTQTRQVGPAPARDRPPTATGTAVIRGRVFAADTGRPLRRARITASAPELGSDPRQTSTSVDGRYEIKDLPGGRYSLTVTRAGYLMLRYGQRRPLEQGKPLQVLDKQAVEHVDFSLPRMSVITGRVYDEASEPVEGAQVYAMRQTYFDGHRRLVPVAGGGPGAQQTDDAGQFRILGLPPGTYYLRATLRDTWSVTENGTDTTLGYAPTYFPSTPNPGDSKPIAVGVGRQLDNNDITLIPGRAATVSGMAFDSQGRPLAGQIIGLNQETRGPDFAMLMSTGRSSVNPDGSFTIKNVPPGEYKLVARATGEKGTEAATLPIVVNGVDIDNAALLTAAGGSIRGQVVVDVGVTADVASDRIRVSARLVDADLDPRVGPPGVDNGRVKADWTFAVTDIYGPARLRVTLPDGWMVKTISLGDREIAESPFNLRSGEEISNVQIVITNKVTTVAGQLVDDKGAPLTDGTVIVFSSDSEKWTEGSRFVRSARPDQQGQFQIKGLPAGEYHAVAVEYVEEGLWNDPEYLEALRRYGQRVALADNDSRLLALKLAAVERP